MEVTEGILATTEGGAWAGYGHRYNGGFAWAFTDECCGGWGEKKKYHASGVVGDQIRIETIKEKEKDKIKVLWTLHLF